ncbi:MAG: proline dehydrogenase family protein [Ignavibacteriae bacterium]|nr:proline dehydrogenase family protein [Ignavibacteriota bacterium]
MSLLNTLIVKTLPIIPKSIIKSVAKRYIAGDSLPDAVRVSKELSTKGASSTIDVLGEFVTSRERSLHEWQTASSVLDAIAQNKLDSYLSVKLTSLGLDIDREFGFANVRSLVEKAAELGIFVRMDMENSPYTSLTLDFYKRLRAEGFDNIGVVLQAYMRRSEDDIRSLLALKPSVRLCKGIYIESPEIAFKQPDEIRTNYKKLLRMLLDGGANVRIATHDDELIDDAIGYVTKNNLSKSQYEFQMLLGVREERRKEIIRSGFGMRIYVPFGSDWYGYSTRRLKENPQVAGYVLKAMFTGG